MLKNLLFIINLCVVHIVSAYGYTEAGQKTIASSQRCVEQYALASGSFHTQNFFESLEFSAETKRLTALSGEKASDENKLYVNNQINISNVYPNPATSYIEFDYTLIDAQASAKIIIRNVLGSVVSEHPLRADQNNITLSTEEFVAGVYFYTLSVNSKNLVTKKFLVKK